MWRTVGTTGFVGIQILLALWLGRLAGGYVDSKLGSAPWFTWVGTVMGMGVSIQLLVLVVRQYKKSLKEESPPHGHGNDGPGPN